MIIERLVGWMETAATEDRARAADTLVRAWHKSQLDEEQREAAEAAMTCILDDEDAEVRLAFAKALSEVPNPPRHLVLALADDEPMVSLPVLVGSPILLDIELISILRSGNDEQQMAIACRYHITPKVCRVIAREGSANACLMMITNPSARLSEDDFHEIAIRHGEESDLRKCLLARDDIGVRARVILIEHYALSLLKSDEADEDSAISDKRRRELIEVCDKATITFAAQISDREIREVVEALIERKKLTTSFLLRAICMGNLSLFAHSLSVLSGQSLARVERVLQDNRAAAFHAIYTKAGLPVSAMDVFRLTITSWRHHLDESDGGNHDRLPYLVTREVVSSYEGQRDRIVDDLMMLLRKICTDAARDTARSRIEQIAIAESEKPLALPAPDMSEYEMTAEELTAFAMELAEELADAAIRDEMAMEEDADMLVAANGQETGEGTGSSLLDSALLSGVTRAA